MKRTLQNQKGFFALLLALGLGMGTAYAYSFSKTCSTGQTLYYNIINSTNHYVEITYPANNNVDPWGGYTKPSGAITLPSSVTYNGITYYVKRIGDHAFAQCYNLTGSLTIPSSVTSIGDWAFNFCYGFWGDLTIGSSVATIGEGAFSYCTGFSGTLTIPSSVTSIGWAAFTQCTSLNLVRYNATNCADVEDGDYPFEDCTGSLIIGNNVTRIPAYMFMGSDFDGTLTIGTSVNSIGSSAFYQCGFTGPLVIPNSVVTIGDFAFFECFHFSSLSLGDHVQTIYNCAFRYCAMANSGFSGNLTIPNSVTSIGAAAFEECYNFAGGTLTIGTGVTDIGQWAFRRCGFSQVNFNATSCADFAEGDIPFEYYSGTITIGSNVQRIPAHLTKGASFAQVKYNAINCPDVTYDDMPFEGCVGTLTIGSGVQRIPAYMFTGIDFTGTLTIPTSVTSIGDQAFRDCTGFTQLYFNAVNCDDVNEMTRPFLGCMGTLSFGSSVQRIPAFMFCNCDDLTGSLYIPNSVTEIGQNAFNFCSGFTGSLTFGSNSNLQSIYTSAFWGCDGFTGSLAIPNSVEYIDIGAFYNCSGFTGTLTIGNSVNIIGDSAFEECNFSGSLTIPSSVSYIGGWAFYDCSGFTGSLTIPSSVTYIGGRAFENCTGFTSTLTIGTGVTTIGANAFKNCNHFTQVKYNATHCADVTDDDKPFEGCTGTLTIGSYVERIPAYMFSYAAFTGSLSIPNSVFTIGNGAFFNCLGFTGNLSIGNSVNEIGYEAFYYCINFSGTLTLGNSLNTIGTYAFYQCQNLSGSLSIPNSVTTLNTYAFTHCRNFTSLSIGSNVSTINYGAFYGCTNLASMTVYPETPPTLGANVFYNVSKTIPVYVSCNSLEDYEAASGWSAFTNYQCNNMVTVTAVPTAGGSVTGGGAYTSGTSITVTATPSTGYLFMNWTKNGTVVSCDPSYSFYVYGDTDLEAVFMNQSYLGDIIGEGMNVSASTYLPSHSYYNYSLTEQIYTASEMGGSTTINTISFFNEGSTKTRNFDIYMKHTSKTVFSSATNWISATSSDKVFSGNVTMRAGTWTTIVLDTPFAYNGSSNLALIVDDNTGSYTYEPHMSCRTYGTTGNQAIYIYSDGTNYNPFSPSSYTGTILTMKNQIMLNREAYDITGPSSKDSGGTVSGWGRYGKGDLCRMKATANSGYTFVDWTDESGVVVSTDANYSFIVTANRILTAHFMSGTDVCSLTFDLHDSYGDGWNGNQLVVNYPNGMSERLTVPSSGRDATFTLPVADGSHVVLSWIEGGWISECSFAVSYTDGEVMYVATDLDENFTYEFDMDCSGQSSELVYIGNHSKANNYYLPSYSFYNYSLSEQIYTASEIGTSGLINSISFYNNGTQAKTRNYNIYLATTNKTSFSNATDWISTSNATLVYSGNVTMHSGRWTPIFFSTPFDYDGVSNLVLIVDDNTGTYTSSPHMSCLVYPTNTCQALRIYSDGTNYDPTSPSSYTGTLQNVKNQIMLNIESCVDPIDMYVTNITPNSANIEWTSDQYSFELQYREMGPNNDFENGFGLWTTIDADGDGYNWFCLTGNIYYLGHDGSAGLVESESWHNGIVLTPDNYLVSPQIVLGGSISFWASAQDEYYPTEHFGVAVSTTGNSNASDFTTIQEWTITTRGEGTKTDVTRSGNRSQGPWYQYTVDLSAYAGQTGYVAIRHFNCTDMFRLNVDDITVVQPGVNSAWITDYHAAQPYALTGLMPATQYEVKVRSNCVGNHYSDWAYTTFTTPMPTQTVALTTGVNWFSTYLDITLDDLKDALVATGNTSITIKSKTNSTTYNGVRWRGNLNTLDVTQMYMIQVNTPCVITLTGMPLNPAEHPITIKHGPNWIGFPLNVSMSLTDAFAGFAVNGDVVKSKASNATYTNRWRGTLNTLQPGQGYIYNSASSTTRVLSFAQFEYVDLGLPSGTLWATCNVGASSPEDYGDYFAWGETTTKDTYNWSTYQYANGTSNSDPQLTKYCNDSNYGYSGFTDNLTTLLPEDDAVTANWGNGWRMPTNAEWEELYITTTKMWTTQNGVNGYLFTASNGNSIFMPAAGGRSGSGLVNDGSYGYYWTSLLVTSNPRRVCGIIFHSNNVASTQQYRYIGLPIRPVRSAE